ncbi:MAG: hypothetical protein AMXMBFR34_12370 [Myxococcaceae bacterium]
MQTKARFWRWSILGVGVGLGLWLCWDTITGSLGWERVGPRPGPGRQVVVLLHGHGAPADDLVGLAQKLSDDGLSATSFVMPSGPHRVGFSGRTWVPQLTAPSREELAARVKLEVADTRAKLWKLMNKLRGRGVACENLWLGGFSLGGRMAVEAALTAPADCHLAGVIVMSGGGLDEVALPDAAAVPGMRVLVTHGSSDGVVSVGAGSSLAHALSAAGHDVRWLQFQGGHQIPDEVRAALAAFLQGEAVGEAPP